VIRAYLQLVRVPGIFTAFSNILLGFFVFQNEFTDYFYLIYLLASSGFLFSAGMTLNDYFDYNIDKKERPFRPLPTGKISIRTAAFLGYSFLVAGNMFSLIIGLQTFVLTLLMTILILSYNAKLKTISVIGIINLSSIRFLNVILGTTIVALNYENMIIAIPIAIFIAGISVKAKSETKLTQKNSRLSLILIITTIIFVLYLIFDNQIFIQFLFLGIFALTIFVPFLIFKNNNQTNVQRKITFQLLSIIILDATLVGIFSSIMYSFIILSLFVPAYLLSRRLYLT